MKESSRFFWDNLEVNNCFVNLINERDVKEQHLNMD